MRNKDKCMGAYIGAAIGDAMGGPVECSHYKRIKKLVGEVKGLLPYDSRYALGNIGPGYALETTAGSITDDTFIRKDFTNFILEVKPPWTPEKLSAWLLKHADFEQWWPMVVPILISIDQRRVDPAVSGLKHMQGGGIGWWTPFAVIHAGKPQQAAQAVWDLATIWKAPFEHNLAGAVMAGMAESVREGASWESVVETVLSFSGPLAKKLLNRAIDIAERADNVWDLAEKLYARALIHKEPSRELDGPMPPEIGAVDYTDEQYMTCYYAEQIPLAMAAFVFAKGEPDAIPVCCSVGRDCDSIGTAVGGWVGGLHGLSGLPKEWVEPVQAVNLKYLNLYDLADRISSYPLD